VILRRHRPGAGRRKLHRHMWIHGLPLKMPFRRSKLYISAIVPVGLGFLVGILSAVMGIGGGFRHGARHDLHAGHADRRRARHLSPADHLRRRQRDRAAGGEHGRWTRC